MALSAALICGETFAAKLDDQANRSTVRWAAAKHRSPVRETDAAGTSGKGRLKWRARKAKPASPAEPDVFEQSPEAAPLAGLELRSAAGTPLSAIRDETSAQESSVIVLTTGEAPVVDPFSDPFGDNEGRPSELKLFPVKTAGELQPFDEDGLSESGSDDADAIDEAALEEMKFRQAPPEKMPQEDLYGDDTQPLPIGDLAQNPAIEPDKCISPRDLKPIREITNQIAAEPGLFPQECTLGDEPFLPRKFAPTTFTWKASALCHKPLYFEQVGVERYGHTWGPFLQPVLGTAHFFGSAIMLPYKMGVEPPWECVYPLGYYRPGSCAPYTVGPVPISLRGVMAQAGATLGFVYIFAP